MRGCEMRTLRLLLAGMVMLALMGGLSVMVTAQSEEAPTPAFVTGNEECRVIDVGTLVDSSASHVRRRGFVTECENVMSDARVSGTYTNVSSSDWFRGLDKYVIWGTHVLDEPTGGWDCSYAGTNDPTGANDGLVFGVCPGTGEFEGLTYVFQHVWRGTPDADIVDGDFGDGTSLFGIIYEGAAPVTLESVEQTAG
jgi:hypothetical protein